ncbi:FecR family protein [Paraflavisolibacter sp. H34]|uniref:FecR family protein n=1 Tax=Huijunlia imazamoxiresistens TaxID=3127457 RepID=UPI0030175307
MDPKFKELVARHLNATLLEEEQQEFAQLLRDPENLLYLAAELDARFQEEGGLDRAEAETGALIYQKIQQQLQAGRQPAPETEAPLAVPLEGGHRSRFLWVAVAAAVLLLVAAALLWQRNEPVQPPMAVQKEQKASGGALAVIRHERNTSGAAKKIQLPDGSVVVLEDKGELTYGDPWGATRDITLSGKARFTVTKDPGRPFTVTSGAVATTALGTEFSVTAFKHVPGTVVVRLYEGRVVVRAVNRANKKMRKEVYLLPGQEFVYGAVLQVKAFEERREAAEESTSEALSPESPSLPQNAEGSWYMFNNQSLEDVFHQLAALYNAKIIFTKKDVTNIYFTGRYSKSDSLETILKRIGILHDLKITKQDTAFLISK